MFHAESLSARVSAETFLDDDELPTIEIVKPGGWVVEKFAQASFQLTDDPMGRGVASLNSIDATSVY